MAKTRRNHAAAAAPAPVQPPPPPAPPASGPSWWPEDFAPPRVAAILGLGAGVIAFAAGMAGTVNGLLWFKRAIAWFIGISDPMNVAHPQGMPPTSWDAAALLTAFAMLVAGGLIHPSLGLALLFIFRPWLDGYTYPTDNLYFVWGVLFLFVLWAVRVLMRGERIRFLTPTLLLAALFSVLLLTTIDSIELNRSYRQLVLWCGYCAIFILTANIIRDRVTFGVLMTGLCGGFAAQSLFALLHFEYLLPFLRQMVQDPAVLRRYFNTSEITPELARRFMRNRAFGSMLFPNALAAYLLLGIPFALTASITSWRAWRIAWAARAPEGPAAERRYRAVALAGVAWLAAAVTAFFALQFRIAYFDGPLPWHYETYPVLGWTIAAGIAAAAPVFWLTNQFSARLCGITVRAAGLPALLVLEALTLWVTYSRGGLAALFAAALVAILLLVLPARAPGLMARFRLAPAVLLLAIALWAVASGPDALAQDPPQTQPPEKSTVVTPAGQSLSMGEIVTDTASFRLRLTYWRVGLSMALDNFWTGVGLGNFAVAYPKYQYLGAGDVKEAHNGYLQMFCETGIFGALLFAVFWAFFVLWGAMRILRETDSSERLLLTGLYCGVLAFLFHAFMDINFSQPSLAMFVMLFAGIFFARAGISGSSRQVAAPPSVPHQLLALPMLVAAALIAGLGMRVFVQDLSLSRVSLVNVASTSVLEERFAVTRHVLDNTFRLRHVDDAEPPWIYVTALADLLPDRAALEAMGDLYIPAGPGAKGMMRLAADQPIPASAVLHLTRPKNAKAILRERMIHWVRELERIDARFPHSPELAAHIADWYNLFVKHTGVGELAQLRREYLTQYLAWAERAKRRSPWHASIRSNYGEALWMIAANESPARADEYYLKAMDEFRTAAALSPTQPVYLESYVHVLMAVGGHWRDGDRKAEGERLLAEANALNDKFKDLSRKRGQMGLD